jgi:uncharacterized membrane protein
MNGLPLHPAIVHLPVAMAMLMPLLAAGFAWALWTGRISLRAWMAVVALQALLVAGGLVAMKTGEGEEDRVEAVVQESAIHRHEEYAEQFVWAAGASLALAALVLVGRRAPVSNTLAGAFVLATLGVAGMGLRVGHAGGQLVYVHGAASAYTAVAGGTSASGNTAQPTRRVDDDDRH